jgi:hypothetical protein
MLARRLLQSCALPGLLLLAGCWQFNETRDPVSTDIVGRRLVLREEVQVLARKAWPAEPYMFPPYPSLTGNDWGPPWADPGYDLYPVVCAVLHPGTEVSVVLVRRIWHLYWGTQWFVFCRILPEGRVEHDVLMPYHYFRFPVADGERIGVDARYLEVRDAAAPAAAARTPRPGRALLGAPPLARSVIRAGSRRRSRPAARRRRPARLRHPGATG